MHKLKDNYQELDNFFKIIKGEIKLANSQVVKNQDSDVELSMNEIYFFPDLEGKTPLHYTVEESNNRVTDIYMNALAGTDFDHHSRFIYTQFPELVDKVPLTMISYFEGRKVQPNWIVNYTRGSVEALEDCNFAMCKEKMWTPTFENDIAKKMFISAEAGQE